VAPPGKSARCGHGFASTISRPRERLCCGLRDERTDIRAFLPLGETKRRGSGIPPYSGILLALCIAYVVPSAGTFE